MRKHVFLSLPQKAWLCFLLLATTFIQSSNAQCGPGQVIQTVQHYNLTEGSLPLGNTVSTTTSSSVGSVAFTGFTNFSANFTASFPTTTNNLSGGGAMVVDIDDTEAGTITYTFCRPLVNPYIFIGTNGIQAGTFITAVGQSLTAIDGEAGFVVQGGNTITNNGTGVDMAHGYVQVNGTISSLTLNITNILGVGGFPNDFFTIGIGSCLTLNPSVGTPITCVGPNVLTPVNFQTIGATPAMFNSASQVSPMMFTNLYDEFGQKIDVQIETINATADYCGTFSNNTTINGSAVTNTTTTGNGVAYWINFSRPVKASLVSAPGSSLREGETVMITTATGGAIPIIGAITSGASGIIGRQLPSFPGITRIEGGVGGNTWSATPTDYITRICLVYQSSNPNELSEGFELLICNRPCELRFPTCARQDTRTNTAKFSAPSSPTSVNATLGANNFTMTTPATAPIVKTRMTEANRLGECADADKFMMPRSGGWAEICAAAGTNGQITLNFTSPVTDPNIHIWGMKSGTTIDFTPTGCCVHMVRGWNGATLNNNIGGFPTIATDGNGGAQADGIYQISGVFSTITLNINSADRDWVILSVGESVCDPSLEAQTCTPDPLYCSTPNTVRRTVNAVFNTGSPSSASGTTFDPEADSYSTSVNVTVTNNAGGALAIYDFTSVINGVTRADAGCTSGDLSQVRGGKIKFSAANGSWQNGLLTIDFGRSILNPLIDIRKIINTRLSFAPTFDICGNNDIQVVQLSSKGGFAVNNCQSVSDANAWADGMQASGLVQLIGQFTSIRIDVDKLSANPDKFELSIAEQVCVDPNATNFICEAELPTRCFNPNTSVTSTSATFSKVNNSSANGVLMIDGTPSVINVSATNTVLTASHNRAMQAFGDPSCYSIAPLDGGLVMFRDMGGNNTITFTLNNVVCNPLIYVKDLVRTQLSFANTMDVNGNPICCMKRLSGSGGFNVNEASFLVRDDNPTEHGTCQDAIVQSGGIIQLIGSFNTITINTSRPSDNRFDNFSLGLATDPMCMDIPTPFSLDVKKKVWNIMPKDANNPTGNQIVTFLVEAQNKSGVKLNNVFLADFLDEKFTLSNGFVAVASAPKVIWPHNAFQHGNPNFNGITEFDLLTTTTENNMLNPGELIRLEYSIEFNPTQFNLNWRYENKLFVGSLNMPAFSPDYKDFNLPLCLPSNIMLPTNPVVDIVNGSAPMEFASWLQCYGKTKVIPHPQCGKITWAFNMCVVPFTQHCGPTGIHHSQFTGIDECGNMYMYRGDFTTIDKHPPVWDMKPMNKALNCDDPNSASELSKWLATAGNAWFSDPGSDFKPVVTHNYTGSNQNCNSGPLTVTFTLTDACGNKTSEKAELTVVDNKAPSLTAPANVTVQCGNAINWGNAVATDNCGTPTVTFTDITVSSDCINGGLVTRTWKATDACGNITIKTQTAYLEPTKMVISMNKPVSDKILSCSEPIVFDTPEMSTSCPDGVLKSTFFDKKVAGNCPMDYEVERTWVYSDNCGGSYTVKQVISISDEEAPTFDAKLPQTFVMKKAIFNTWKKLYFDTYVKAKDKCSKVNQTAPIYTVLNNKSVECKVVATDECANTSFYTCIVTFEDANTVKTSNKEADRNGNSDLANTILAELEQFVNEEAPSEIPIEPVIYPNPTSRMVNVVPAVGYGSLQKIHIYSMDGKVLLNMDVEGQKNDTVTIDISNFQNATYIIEMVHTEKRIFRQVQKIN